MVEKLYNTGTNTAVVVCGACNRQHVVDISKYLDVPKEVKLKVKCKCGKTWSVTLEKRRYFRHGVKLPGKFTYKGTQRGIVEGNMQVVDISKRGMKVRLYEKLDFKAGDYLEVEFRLDNKPKTLVKRILKIKNIDGDYVGLSYPEHKHEDPDVGFYLLEVTSRSKKE